MQKAEIPKPAQLGNSGKSPREYQSKNLGIAQPCLVRQKFSVLGKPSGYQPTMREIKMGFPIDQSMEKGFQQSLDEQGGRVGCGKSSPVYIKIQGLMFRTDSTNCTHIAWLDNLKQRVPVPLPQFTYRISHLIAAEILFISSCPFPSSSLALLDSTRPPRLALPSPDQSTPTCTIMHSKTATPHSSLPPLGPEKEHQHRRIQHAVSTHKVINKSIISIHQTPRNLRGESNGFTCVKTSSHKTAGSRRIIVRDSSGSPSGRPPTAHSKWPRTWKWIPCPVATQGTASQKTFSPVGKRSNSPSKKK